MSSVQEIENAIETLPPMEQDDLFSRLEQKYAQRFDAAIASDLERGALDSLMDQALAEHNSGNSREL